MRIALYIAGLSMIATPALGLVIEDTSNRVPEPETLALLAGAAVAWGIVRWIRRK